MNLSTFQRSAERFVLEDTLKNHLDQCPDKGRGIFPYIRLLKATSNPCSDGVSPAFLGNVFHCLISLIVTNHFFMSSVRHTSFYAVQNTVGFLGCKRTLPSHIQIFIRQCPQLPSTRHLLIH